MKVALLPFTTSTLHMIKGSTSNNLEPMHSFIHYSPSTDVEAYRDATPPQSHDSSTLTSYSNACWGLQIGSAVANGTLLPLFKFRSMSGSIVFKNGGPLGWLSEHQERASLSSCIAEIRTTSATSKKVVDLCNLCLSFTKTSFPILDINKKTLIYNDNNACVKWSHNMTLKVARHIELCKNLAQEWVQDKTIAVEHIAGKINLADIFTKEMCNGTHFCCLCNSFMSWLSNFLNTSLQHSHHSRQRSQRSVAPSAAWVTIASVMASYLSALAANAFFWTVTAMFHLSSASHQLLCGLHGFIPPDLG
jgi:hypothetical protein